MLFTSYQFLLVFFPAVVVSAFLVRRRPLLRTGVLLAASLAFYATWDWPMLALLLGSVLGNYLLGRGLQRLVRAGRRPPADVLVACGIVANLLVLGFYKYLGFLTENVAALTGADLPVLRWALPLGISFFTFEQIGFLVDLRRGAPYRLDLPRFTVFISFFPRLVAGPILRYDEIVPQLEGPEREPFARQLAVGLAIFAMGLAKKAFLADGIAPYVAGPFDAAAAGQPVDLFAAWGGALAYTCQLYFDFSGYSDMAIGAGRCLGIRLPENFDSPYKSRNIVEFWRRWHMTLSRFLRDYLYIGLGGNRRGPARRYANLLLTMLIGGFWHGANWTFLVWGGLHGCYLIANHAWLALLAAFGRRGGPTPVGRVFGVALTFLAVVVGWVFFRAPTLDGALALLRGMLGQHGAELPAALAYQMGPVPAWLGLRTGGSGATFVGTWSWVVVLLGLAFLAPNRQAIVRRLESDLAGRSGGRRTEAWAVAFAAVGFLGFLSVTRASAFLYWQF